MIHEKYNETIIQVLLPTTRPNNNHGYFSHIQILSSNLDSFCDKSSWP